MTHLRKMMLEELDVVMTLRLPSTATSKRSRILRVIFGCPPDQLTPEHIREYQAYLFPERKLAASTVTQRLAALRFFYTQTIKRAWSVADTPYRRRHAPLSSILKPGKKWPTSSTRPRLGFIAWY